MINKLTYRKVRIIVHIIFWLGVLGFYTLLFGTENQDYANSFKFVIWLLPITIVTTYFLNYFLIPQYLLQKKYFHFALFFAYTLVVSITLALNVVMLTLVSIADFIVENMSAASFNIFYLVAGNYVVVFFAVAIKMLNEWYNMERKNLLLEKEGIEIDLKLNEAELKLLKAQIHPHFLFNTLNNLYGLTLSKSEKAPDVVLKISSLLDYMLYRSNKEEVSLEEEIKYITDYIELEKLRYKKLDLSIKFPADLMSLKIAPMILQPFVENAFKHGLSKDMKNPSITIECGISNGNTLEFKIVNSKINEITEDKSGYTEGIGLKNVKRRLEILYPGAYELNIYDNEDSYTVYLKIQLNKFSHENQVFNS